MTYRRLNSVAHTLAAAALFLLLAPSLAWAGPTSRVKFKPEGRYERVTKSPSFPESGRETGLLDVSSASNGVARFTLEVTMNPVALDDGALTRHGLVKNQAMRFKGAAGHYQANDEVLGSCILSFKFAHQSVDVVQRGNCWWFGENVNASGHYVLTEKNISQIVR